MQLGSACAWSGSAPGWLWHGSWPLWTCTALLLYDQGCSGPAVDAESGPDSPYTFLPLPAFTTLQEPVCAPPVSPRVQLQPRDQHLQSADRPIRLTQPALDASLNSPRTALGIVTTVLELHSQPSLSPPASSSASASAPTNNSLFTLLPLLLTLYYTHLIIYRVNIINAKYR